MVNKSLILANEYLNKLLNEDYSQSFELKGVGSTLDLFVALEKLRVKLAFYKAQNDAHNEKINTDTACIIHDLKTPLAIIMGYAECLKDGINDKDYADLIIEKVNLLNNRIIKLLDVSKTKTTSENDKTIINIRDFLPSEFNKYKKLALNNGLSYKINKKIPDCNIYANKNDLASVVQNLVTNAISYNKPKGKIKITIRRYKYFICILVSDSGVGIPKEDLPFVFDKFYKGDKSRTNMSGSGLGLYLVKEIVENHNGKVAIHSKKGKGTIMAILLPILEPHTMGLTSNMINDLPYTPKLLFFLFGGVFLGATYRLLKFEETYNFKYLWAGILSIFLFPITWIADILSILLTNQITYLSGFENKK